MDYYVGIDLGGTNIKAGVVDGAGKIICKTSIKTHADRDQLDIARDMGHLAERVIAEAGLTSAEIKAIGIGSPGTPDNIAGVLIYANNLPFNHLPLRKTILKSLIFLSIYDNDANVAARLRVSPARLKAQRFRDADTRPRLGGGVVINGRIYSGFNNAAVKSAYGHPERRRTLYPAAVTAV
jgi:glucokinase